MEGTKEEFENKMKEVEAKVQPIMTKMYSSATGGEGMPGTAGSGTGPTVEEMD